MKSYYFDNAATSWPKPRCVLRTMRRFLMHGGGNPGRSGHGRSIDAGKIILHTRTLLAELFNIKDPSRIVFTKNATEALNLAILGTLRMGGHVVTTSMEHNSVMRPLSFLKRHGVEVSVVNADVTGRIEPSFLKGSIRPNTALVIVTHVSNVTGTINDIETVGRICHKKGVPFLVDAAQSAGALSIDVEKMHIDLLAFSGHKGLLGPQGTGGLYISPDVNAPQPLMMGGTGSISDSEEQPDFMPDRYESGTLNVVGLAGLMEGVRYIMDMGIDRIVRLDRNLLNIFLDEITGDERFIVYGPGGEDQTGVLSLNIRGISPSDLGELLEREYGIQTRVGLHCAPSAHKTIGSFPDGTVRFSWGIFTGEKDVLWVTRSLKKIATRAGKGTGFDLT